MPEDHKEQLKKVVEKLKAAAASVKKVAADANAADAAAAEVEKEE